MHGSSFIRSIRFVRGEVLNFLKPASLNTYSGFLVAQYATPHSDPQGGGNPLPKGNVAGNAPDMRQYRFAQISGNSGILPGIERRQVAKWQRKPKNAHMKKP
jgi:hypothetical protein